MKKLLIPIFLIIWTYSHAQELYDGNTIQSIEVSFSQSNWDQLMDNAYATSGDYIMAESVSINGISFDSVGVKYKGNSSYRANQIKNPWHIELDTYKEQDFQGYTDIKLANGYNDPSFLRDVLGYQIIRQYMDAPLANYANLYVNGTLIGLYSNTESVSKKFVKSRFGSKSNAFVKCSPPDGANPQGGGNYPNLVYLGQDSTDYYEAYEIKSDAGWQELIDLCDTLENHINEIEKILDIDRTLWMLAFDNAIVNLDSYIGLFSQNYYLYRDDYGRFLPIVWDLNEAFGVFSQTGTLNLNNTYSKQNMTHLLHANDASWPLVQKILSIPRYKKIYLAHMKTMLKENFENEAYYATAETYQTLISSSVQADQNKFFTYNNFLTNLNSDVNSGPPGPMGQSTPGISNLMDERSDYLLGLSDFTKTEPVISDITLSNSTPVINEPITISVNISDENEVYLGYRNDKNAPFTKVQMYDDGVHNDGVQNDGIYGIELKVTSTEVQYYIYAENDNIGKFSPQRAEYEYYNITATVNNPTVGDLVINELMASNDTSASDQDGDFDDWIELYNNGSESIDLSGYYLSDDANDLTQWSFPAGTFIEADGYLIVWADNDEDQEGLHANFKLSASGESVLLIGPSDTTMVDAVEFGEQMTDISYSRIPNGIGSFELTVATFNANNDGTTDCEDLGGDMDNDGVCADYDCDDNDPSVGASQPEGTACDDGDVTTINDVILADGCICAGVAITLSDVVINELMASNETIASDQDGDFDDWIELYNNGMTSIDLSGYYLSDDPDDLKQWSFPAGTYIEADGYLIVWADNDEDQEGLHANFKLSASGESVLLIDPSDTTIVDAVEFGEQETDVSYGRYPNGTGSFQIMPPTFNSENSLSVNTLEYVNESFELSVFPNPSHGFITISSNVNINKVNIYNMSGILLKSKLQEGKRIVIDLSMMNSAMYYVQVQDLTGSVQMKKIIIY